MHIIFKYSNLFLIALLFTSCANDKQNDTPKVIPSIDQTDKLKNSDSILFVADIPHSSSLKIEIKKSEAKEFSTYYADGNISRVFSGYTLGYDTIKNGPFKSYYNSGKLKSSGMYEENLRIGTFTWFAEEKALAEQVNIGSQTWMTKNLDVETLRNGSKILKVNSIDEWISAFERNIPAYCYLDFNDDNNIKYGKIYNWWCVVQGVAPVGWRVPTHQDFHDLLSQLGGKENNYDFSNTRGHFTCSEEKNQDLVYQLCSKREVIKIDTTYYKVGGELRGGQIIPCENCKNWNSEYRSKVPCHVCKDTRDSGKRTQTWRTPVEVRFEIERYYNYTKSLLYKYYFGGSNNTNFSAEPGGYLRISGDPKKFVGGGTIASFWSSSVQRSWKGKDFPWVLDLIPGCEKEYNSILGEEVYVNGYTIRCIKE